MIIKNNYFLISDANQIQDHLKIKPSITATVYLILHSYEDMGTRVKPAHGSFWAGALPFILKLTLSVSAPQTPGVSVAHLAYGALRRGLERP